MPKSALDEARPTAVVNCPTRFGSGDRAAWANVGKPCRRLRDRPETLRILSASRLDGSGLRHQRSSYRPSPYGRLRNPDQLRRPCSRWHQDRVY